METPFNNDENKNPVDNNKDPVSSGQGPASGAQNQVEQTQSNPITHANEPRSERLRDSLFKKQSSPAEEVIIHPLRTYEDDIKDAISSQSMSTARIVMAEQQRRTAQEEEEAGQKITAPKNQLFIILTVLLLVGAVGVFGYFYLNQKNFFKEIAKPLINIDRPQFIQVDSQEEVVVATRAALSVFADVQRTIKTPIEPRTVREILLTKTQNVESDSGTKEQKVVITTEQLFDLLNAREPSALSRSLDKDFMLGVYSAEDYNDPFLLFKVNDFNAVYGNMLEWETNLSRDVQLIFTSLDENNIPKLTNENSSTNAGAGASSTASTTSTISTGTASSSSSTSTASSQSATQQTTGNASTTNTTTGSSTLDRAINGIREQTSSLLTFNPRLFEDTVVSNRDLRAVIRRSGTTVFYYSFIDEETLIMATNTKTIGEIIQRLQSNRLLDTR